MTRLHFTIPVSNAVFHPANTELLHSFGMLAYKSDVVSPAVNLGFLVMLLLAAWCVGRPLGVAPATMTGAAVLAGLPHIAGSQAGSAMNDIAAGAFFL